MWYILFIIDNIIIVNVDDNDKMYIYIYVYIYALYYHSMQY